MNEQFYVKDINLAQQGDLNIELAERRMGALIKIKNRFSTEKPFKGLVIAMALHVTKETAVLVKTFIEGGAKVALASCNPLSTQDDAAASLAKLGVNVFAYKGESKEDYYKFLNAVLAFKPNITIDDGCDLVNLIHTQHKELIPSLIGGCEETTTGIIRLHAMQKEGALKYPVIAVNDNKTKHLLDNYYGTGQSSIDGIIRATNVLLAGKNFVIIGYGDCGKGAALRAKGHGSNVIITEVDPFRALQAKLDGFQVMQIKDAAKLGDIFLTVTGNKHVLSFETIKTMKDGVLLANAGHFDIEIDLESLAKNSKIRRVRPFVEEYSLNEKRVYVLGEGRLVNLAAAEGHPSEVMATSFAGQALACEYLVKNKGNLKPQVITLPESIDNEIANLQLEDIGVKIDQLTKEQKEYLNSWKEGT